MIREVKSDAANLVRVHLQSTFNDILHSDRSADRSWTLPSAMQYIAEHDGVLVILGKQEHSEDIEALVKAFAAEDAGEKSELPQVSRHLAYVGVGSQILADLGIQKMRLMSLPKKYHALSGFHLEVVEYVEPQ